MAKDVNGSNVSVAGNVDRINVSGKEIVLVGTAHVSKESVKLVRETIEHEKPDSVGIELCEKRHETLSNRKKWEETKITTILKEGRASFFLANLLLSSFQRKIGKDLEVKPGAEMIEGMDAAKKAGSKVVLLDRDISVTLKRAWRKMGLFEKFKMVFSLLYGIFDSEEMEEEMVEKLKEKDMISEMMEELGREAPSAKEVLIDERDIYIANKITAAPGKKIVAVVGAGHVEGIKRHLGKKDDITPFEQVPDGSRWVKFVGYLIPLAIVGMMVYGFFNAGIGDVYDSVLYWFLVNGAFSAFGVMLVRGHPITVVSAFIAAPFTSLNPFVAAGYVAGLVEAKYNEPDVRDFENLNEITTLSGFYNNRVTRILLIVAFANLGSTIGTFLGGSYIFKKFF